MTLFQDGFTNSTFGDTTATYLKLTGTSSTSAVALANGMARFGTTSTVAILLNPPNAPTSPDQFVGLDVATAGGPAGSQGVLLRATPTGDGINYTGYRVRVTATDFSIQRQDSGGSVTLASYAIAQGSADRIAGKMVGPTLTAYYKGAPVMQVNDTTYPSGTVGVANSVTSGVSADNFEAGNTASDLPASGYADPPPPPTSPPGQVLGLAAGTPTSVTIPLTWTATATAASYVVEYRKAADTAWSAGPTPTAASTTLTALTSSTAYQVRVSAKNAAGTGTPSDVITASTTAPPASAPVAAVTSYRGLTWNLQGEEILPGEPLHTLSVDAYGPGGTFTPPPWLTVGGDVSQKISEGGFLALKATGGVPASLTLNPVISTTAVRAVKIELTAFRWSASPPGGTTLALAAGTTTVGARAVQLASDTFTRLTNGESSTDTLTSHMGSSATERRRITLLVIFATKEVLLRDGGQIVGYRDCTDAWVDGDAPVSVTIGHGSSTVEARLARLSITTYL